MRRLGLNVANHPLSLGNEGAPSDSESPQSIALAKSIGTALRKREELDPSSASIQITATSSEATSVKLS